MKTNKKILTTLAVLMSLTSLTACGTNNIVNNGTDNNSVIQNSENLKFSKASTEHIQLFQKVFTVKAAEIGATSAGSAGVAVSRPAIAPAPDIASDSRLAYPIGYFPSHGPFEQYVVIDYQEAKSKGSTGTYLEILKNIAQPLVKELGSDTRLVSSNGSSNNSGVNDSPNTSTYGSYQWQFTYVSSEKKQLFSVFVSETETLVIKQQWGLQNIETKNIKIDSNKAIEIFKGAISNKNLNAENDSEIEQIRDKEMSTEILYNIPENATWNFYIQQSKGSLVWNINMYIQNNEVERLLKDGETYTNTWYSGGYASIDATTGKIISFRRPVKYTRTYTNRTSGGGSTDPGVPPMPMDAVAVSSTSN